jgi:DNA-binding transcriptional ArsR family regulator
MPDYIEPGDGRLPSALVVGLDHKVQHALNHPIRRELLRCLNREAPLTLRQLASDLPSATLSGMSYHLKVLATYGAARVAGEGAPTYMSALTEEADVLVVLQATEEWDRARQQEGVAGLEATDEGGPVE